MSATSIAIAEQVKTVLNAASVANVFTPLTFTATREYVVDIEQPSATLTVQVVPTSVASSVIASDTDLDDTVIEIGVFDKITSATRNSECDALVLLCEQIRNHLRSAAGQVVIAGSSDPLETEEPTIDPIYDQALLKTNSRFASVVKITYRADRGRG